MGESWTLGKESWKSWFFSIKFYTEKDVFFESIILKFGNKHEKLPLYLWVFSQLRYFYIKVMIEFSNYIFVWAFSININWSLNMILSITNEFLTLFCNELRLISKPKQLIYSLYHSSFISLRRFRIPDVPDPGIFPHRC